MPSVTICGKAQRCKKQLNVTCRLFLSPFSHDLCGSRFLDMPHLRSLWRNISGTCNLSSTCWKWQEGKEGFQSSKDLGCLGSMRCLDEEWSGPARLLAPWQEWDSFFLIRVSITCANRVFKPIKRSTHTAKLLSVHAIKLPLTVILWMSGLQNIIAALLISPKILFLLHSKSIEIHRLE